MPIDQLIDINCHRLVFIFDAFYFQSRFPKTRSLYAYKQSGERIQISNICAYCECVHVPYMLERVGYQDFSNANRWQSMSCDHFCVIIDWSLIGRCQSMPITNKASIVIDWSIDFPIIGFIDCSSPVISNPLAWRASHCEHLWTIHPMHVS